MSSVDPAAVKTRFIKSMNAMGVDAATAESAYSHLSKASLRTLEKVGQLIGSDAAFDFQSRAATIVERFKGAGLTREAFIDAGVRMPSVFGFSARKIIRNVEAMVAHFSEHGLTEAKYIRYALRFPQLFYQRPQTLTRNLSQTIQKLSRYGLTESDYISAVMKRPSLFTRKADSVVRTVNSFAERYRKAGMTKAAFITAAVRKPALFHRSKRAIENVSMMVSRFERAGKEHVESDANQLGGDRPLTRYSIYAGRFTVTDYFDNNAYTHDPRTQFMAWGVMYNGAWDYPADTRGYTWGIVREFHTPSWAFRYGISAEPRVANGPHFDRMLFRDHGQTAEIERRYAIRKHPGAFRPLGYANRADVGTYAEALRLAGPTGTPDVVATRPVSFGRFPAVPAASF